MNFTYNSYLELVKSLKEHDYKICHYSDWDKFDKCVILRHDIDSSITKAVKMAVFEGKGGGCQALTSFY